jgi:MerR family mercuric resistance operon transcriptional regulator
MQSQFIGKVSRDTGMSIDTIRFYEKVGVIEHPSRTRGRFRLFSLEDIQALRVIRKLVDLGFSLSEIKHVFGSRRRKMDACIEVRDLLGRKLVEVRCKIRGLQCLEEELCQDLHRSQLTHDQFAMSNEKARHK